MNTSLESVGATLVIGAYTVLGIWLLYHFLLNYGTYRKFSVADILGNGGGDLSRSTAGMLFIGLSFAVGMIVEDFSDTLFRQNPTNLQRMLGHDHVYVDETVLRANALFPTLFDTYKLSPPKHPGIPKRSAVALDLARNGAFCDCLGPGYLGKWKANFDAVIIDEQLFASMVQELDSDPDSIPPAYRSKYFSQARIKTAGGQAQAMDKALPASRFYLYSISQQVYYQAKNTVYLLSNPYQELERIHLRLDFVRSLLFVSYWLLVLVIVTGGLFLLASLLQVWITMKRGSRATEQGPPVRDGASNLRIYTVRLILVSIALLALTAMSKAVYIHEDEQFHLRVFGIYGTIRSDFGMRILQGPK